MFLCVELGYPQIGGGSVGRPGRARSATITSRSKRSRLTGQMYYIPVVLSMNYLAHGCPVVRTSFDTRQALDVLQQERVSAFLGIPTMLGGLLEREMRAPGWADRDIS